MYPPDISPKTQELLVKDCETFVTQYDETATKWGEEKTFAALLEQLNIQPNPFISHEFIAATYVGQRAGYLEAHNTNPTFLVDEMNRRARQLNKDGVS